MAELNPIETVATLNNLSRSLDWASCTITKDGQLRIKDRNGVTYTASRKIWDNLQCSVRHQVARLYRQR
jgi:hypothetical protein